MVFYQLILKNIRIPIFGFYPFLSSSTKRKALSNKQLLTFRVSLVNGTIHLMEHDVMEEVFDAQSQSGLGIALLAESLVDKDAQTRPLVDAVIVEDVDTANGLATFGEVDHQAELLVAEQVVVAQQELLDLESGIRHMGAAHPPDVAVVLPKENLSGILRLGATERYRVILDEHFVLFV